MNNSLTQYYESYDFRCRFGNTPQTADRQYSKSITSYQWETYARTCNPQIERCRLSPDSHQRSSFGRLAANNNFGIQIHISDERDYLLDTGGGIKHATAFLQGNEPFLIHNVDILSDIDLRALYNHHIETNPLATLLVSKRNTSRYLLFNKENKLCGWRNRETGEVKSFYPDFDPNQYNEYAFSGIHVLSPKIFDWMEEWTGKFSIINFYLSICAKANIHAYADEDLHLIDVGKPETLQVAEKWMKTLIV